MLQEGFDPKKVLQLMRREKSAYWERVRETKALTLFHEVARRVPAYKDFLKKNRIDPGKIKTFKDFQLVPPVSKKNYLKEYPLEKVVWPNELHSPLVWTATSGSTGKPFYFPRGRMLDEQYSVIAELFLNNNLRGDDKSALVIVGFGMGVWIGGLFTYEAYEIAAQRGNYPISILTTGINKKEIYNALRQLAPHFSQTILIGYPPFVKDILDGASSEGVNIKKLNLRLFFAAEAFTENFRDYLARIGHLKNVYLDTLNIYGTADIGAMAFETPVSILVRRLAAADKSQKLFNAIFGNISKTPTLAQYNPLFITFEAPEGEIYLTGSSTIPLVRYAIGDHGGAASFTEMSEKLHEHGKSLKGEIARHNLLKYASELPFVFVYERVDFATTLYGLQIYPEHIREGLIQPSVNKLLTGKFTMLTKFDKKHNQYLELHLEMARGQKHSKKMEQIVMREVIASLEKLNSEFHELHRFLGKRAWPKLVFWAAEDPQHFRPGVKQQWVKKIA